MNKYETIEGIKDKWMLEFQYDSTFYGELICIKGEEKELLHISASEEGIAVSIHTVWESETKKFGKNPEFTFDLYSPALGDKICICWQGASVQLYVDGILQDEDWPLGTLSQGEWAVWTNLCVSAYSIIPIAEAKNAKEQKYTESFQNFVLPGHNTGVGDCMPFYRNGRYCLYYLLDRRGHGSKQGLGAHQWAQISSEDLKTWTIHPMAIGITEQWEGSICTGSLIQKEEQIYAFYAVRMSDGSPAKLTWAVSEDGVHFEKSGKYFTLTEPYEPVSARDPMVFRDTSGKYHMLVTTSLVKEGRYGGCLAHLTSSDLESWEQDEPFIVPGYGDQPECSDYFYWNGWYYLVFSNFGTARYRMSREPFGPWIRPETDELDAMEIRVPKTAQYGERRLSTGFLSRHSSWYAGNAVTHELYQREDGTLAIKHLEEILPGTKQIECIANVVLEGGSGRKTQRLPDSTSGIRLQAKMEACTSGMMFGICLHVADVEYRIEIDPAGRTAAVIKSDDSFWYGNGRNTIKNVSVLGGLHIDLIVEKDILDIVLGDGRSITVRLEASADDGICAEFYALAGTLEVTDIRYYVLV